jgi:hypothetical protein
MTAKNVFYAAVGAPVVAARRVVDAVAELRSTLNKEADTLGKTANKRVAVWADEGEKLVNRITDVKMVDELTSKVDFDQVSNQVSKLREQLEDMLSTWRASFRPEKMPTVTVEASLNGVTVETKKPLAKKSGTRKATPKKASAKKAPARSVKAAAKTTASAKATSKVPAAKKAPIRKAPVRKASARKAPARTTAKKANAPARTSAGVAG